MTESGACTVLGRLEGPYRMGYCGPPAPGMEVRLGGDGEILVRGPGLMTRYRNQPEATARVIDAEGWLHTGDTGAFNELGHLRMVDRKKELIINDNGKNMSPVKIESEVKNAGSLIGGSWRSGIPGRTSVPWSSSIPRDLRPTGGSVMSTRPSRWKSSWRTRRWRQRSGRRSTWRTPASRTWSRSGRGPWSPTPGSLAVTSSPPR
jgi:acyl-CoA synthetase (AMP-forming)/AMP-acid ligase II